ncbi:hypothetical protein ROSINTL182_07488 [Roseburia intestinalis L1-82]|uniref:Uncharacterized protein n=1 Tax=Roseburia intestinalis L1-82 TaxID=536231 RepID=C7GC53_9FIRM|nr:hypothetical protein ROSINTL182_07488 [Roseburia intestinalis L1-82]
MKMYVKKSIKITASGERVFRLRLAAPNDTICLLRATVSSGALPPCFTVGRFLFI